MIENNLKKQNQKANLGITLVALVITIIILLILAGVVIKLAVGDNGVIIRAKDSASKYNKAQDYEIGIMDDVSKEYDAMLRWALTGADKEKVTTTGNAAHSGLSGVYETGKTTVSGKVDKINNIFDLEGNCWEWTAEADYTFFRNYRGGYFGYSYSPDHRDYSSATYSGGYNSSRLSLYLN